MNKFGQWVVWVAGVGACASASGAQHLMKVTEVFPGTASQPMAQYVELQMYTGGQNQVNGHAVRVYDAADTIVGTYTFTASVPNGASQSHILIATPQAESLFGVTADLAMTADIPLAGGKACFDSFDCVAWGNYGGDASNPSASGSPFNAAGGLQAGRAITRDISAGNAATLENSDDTGDSAADFDFNDAPAPTNNAGSSGALPGSGGGSTGGGSTGGGASGGAPASGGGDSGALGGLRLSLLLIAGLRRRLLRTR